jgi:myo-inositol 2-dehydrogenase / D-chiro-inositol 1-dehydrogenase
MAMHGTVGVGIIGAGSVVQGIHLPALARVGDALTVRHIADVDEVEGARVAARVGARFSNSVEEMLKDDAVDVVAVCSPNKFHADHVIAACHAGVKAVLCEKPFATTREEAEEIAGAVRESGTRVIVGTMHSYDPAWIFARERWGDLPENATSIRSSIVLPFNDRFERWATEPEQARIVLPRDTSVPGAGAAAILMGFLMLAIHDMPLVRAFLPDWRDARIISAENLRPVGYAVTVEAGGRIAQFVGSMRNHWHTEWQLEVSSPESALLLDFSPSYVQGGSGTATLARGNELQVFRDHHQNGYEREWRHLAAIAADPSLASVGVEELLDDLTFALQLADLAGDHLTNGAIK